MDRRTLSVLAYFTNDGLVARLVDARLDEPVMSRTDVSFENALVGRWKARPVGTIEFSVLAKHLAGDPNVGLVIRDNCPIEALVVPRAQGGSFLVVFPCLMVDLPRSTSMDRQVSDNALLEAGIHPVRPPWIVSIISARHGMSGLDEDPLIAGKGIADTILFASGIADEYPPVKYRRAWVDLKNAILALSAENEKALHLAVKKYPWILLHESDFSLFVSEPRLTYSERTSVGKEHEFQSRTIIPDFMYHLHDQSTLVVEIEAANKRLLKKQKETGYKLPTAKSVASMFQILNYKQIMSGPFGSQICGQIDKPDSWTFAFLLVIGSTLQEDFDERSWQNLRKSLQASNVELRTWDYYLDRLERLRKASDIKPLGQSGGRK